MESIKKIWKETSQSKVSRFIYRRVAVSYLEIVVIAET